MKGEKIVLHFGMKNDDKQCPGGIQLGDIL
jgi:hypothetical protein